jgi:hypothetical protein
LALALGILRLVRWLLRADDPIPRSQVAGLVVSGLATAAAGLTWPVIASAVTGEPAAYIQTEMAWWVPYLGPGTVLPVMPCLAMAWTWLGPIGVVVVIGAVVMMIRWAFSPSGRSLGLEVVAFVLSYTLYLFAVFLPTQSLPRLVLPLSPLLADSRLLQSPQRQRWAVTISIALQAVAVYLLWTIGNP